MRACKIKVLEMAVEGKLLKGKAAADRGKSPPLAPRLITSKSGTTAPLPSLVFREAWKSPERETVESCTAEPVAPVHDRMPFILHLAAKRLDP